MRAHRPDVVILDHVLRAPLPAEPDHARRPAVESGLKLVAGARAIVSNAAIVVFTGWEGSQHAARDAGADFCIARPDVDALWPAIRELRSST